MRRALGLVASDTACCDLGVGGRGAALVGLARVEAVRCLHRRPRGGIGVIRSGDGRKLSVGREGGGGAMVASRACAATAGADSVAACNARVGLVGPGSLMEVYVGHVTVL